GFLATGSAATSAASVLTGARGARGLADGVKPSTAGRSLLATGAVGAGVALGAGLTCAALTGCVGLNPASAAISSLVFFGAGGIPAALRNSSTTLSAFGSAGLIAPLGLGPVGVI